MVKESEMHLLTIGRVVRVSRHVMGVGEKETTAHVVGFSENCTGEVIVILQVPRYVSPLEETEIRRINFGRLPVEELSEIIVQHPCNITLSNPDIES